MNRTDIFRSVLSISGAVFLLAACGPVSQKIFLKEKVIERNAAPRPGIVADHLIVGKAVGAVDLLFIVDNTEAADQALAEFQQSYTQFLADLATDPARQLDVRLQVVTTPNNRSTQNFYTSATPASAAAHLQELFAPLEGQPPILTMRDRGFPQLTASTQAGLRSSAFEGRTSAPLYLIYLLGSDQTEDQDPASLQATEQALSGRGLYQTHAVLISRTTATMPADAFPFCDTFQTTPKALTALQRISWRSWKHYDLCESNWSRYARELFDSILAFKKNLLLSQPPFEPETMTVRSATRLFRYGDDYRFDAQTNEIVFLRAGLVQNGDQLEVSYYIKPAEQVFHGSAVPGGLQDPNPTIGNPAR